MASMQSQLLHKAISQSPKYPNAQSLMITLVTWRHKICRQTWKNFMIAKRQYLMINSIQCSNDPMDKVQDKA